MRLSKHRTKPITSGNVPESDLALLDSADTFAYTSEWRQRIEEGSISALDRANAAMLRADQAGAIFTEDADECDAAKIMGEVARVAEAARITAALERRGDEELALKMATFAEGIATEIDAYDPDRLSGLSRDTATEAARGRRTRRDLN